MNTNAGDALQTDSRELLDFLHHLADMAQQITMRYFRRDIQLRQKSDRTPVTIADRETEQSLRRCISKKFPDHGFVGEETGSQNVDADYTWIIDPIDGTKNFTIGAPVFGTLIALLYQGRPFAGLLDMPALSERWVGIQGQPTLLNGEPCHVSPATPICDAIIHATTPDMFDQLQRQQFNHVSGQCRFRLFGKDCYAYGLLASGFLQLVMEAGLKAVDVLPLVPVIEGAGGIITDWQGQPISLTNCGTALAASDANLHLQVLHIIADRYS